MLDLIALLCLISLPLLVVIVVISFVGAFISLIVKNSKINLVKNDEK